MSNLTHRQSTLLPDDGAGSPSWGASYLVTAYSVGGQAASASSGTTITLRAGHGFAVGDKILIDPGTDNTFSGTDTVQSTTSTTIVMTQSYSVALGDMIVNLGVDTGIAAPNYDASGVTIYSDMDGTTSITNSTATANTYGVYSYWHESAGIWELVRSDATTPVSVTDYSGASSPVRLRMDFDDDGTEELRIGGDQASWGNFAADWDVKIGYQDTIDAANAPNVVNDAIRLIHTFSGNYSAAAQWRETAFFIQRHGVSGSGGGNSDSGGSNIAVGAYNEHRGDGTIAGPIFGCEAAVTMRNTGTISGSCIGLRGAAQIFNAGGSAATMTTAVGVRGGAGVHGGQGNITNAYGVEGLTKHSGTGTITNAYCFLATNSHTGGGTLSNQYGMRITAMTSGDVNNYGLWIDAPSGGSSLNTAIWVDTGEVRFRDESAVFEVRTTTAYFGNGDDRDTTIRFNTSTVDGDITYLGSDAATANFLITRPIRVNNTQAIITSGTATPEGAVTAPVGSLFLRTDGGADTTLYVKETGAGNTGWQAAVIS